MTEQRALTSRRLFVAARAEADEQRYHSIFLSVDVSICVQDYSAVKAALDGLAAAGVADFRAYFTAHPDFVQRAIDLVRTVEANEAMLRLFGATDESQLLGPLHNVLLPDTADAFAEVLIAILDGRRHFRSETVLRTLNGDRRDVLLSMTFRAEDPQLRNVLVSLEDVTERRRAERALRASEAQLRFVTDNAPALIVQCDADVRFRFVNAPYAARFGQRPEQLVGRHVRDVVGEGVYRRLEPHVNAVLGGQRAEFEEKLEYEQIGTRWMHCAYVPEPAPDGSVAGFVAVLYDVTERRAAEEALREMDAALREADQRKNEFLATLSHELRNPLAPLRSSLQLLRRAGPGRNAGDAVFAMMDRQVDHLVRLVDDLLEVSRISRGALELRRELVAVASVVMSALETSRPLIDAAEHALEVDLPDEPLWLDGDPIRLSQILANLLNNAARYTDPGGRIVVEARREAASVRIAVRDSGAGIDAETLPRLFRMFSRASDAQGGLGIGLALARQLAQMHGGTIEAFSAGIGRGSEFVVRLPLAPAPDPAASPAAPPVPNLAAGKRILVVDDNHDAALSLSLLLQHLGAEVRIENGGAAGLAAYRDDAPDVVLLDIGMPQMDGYEVARRIRREFPERKTPIVALTGWGQEDDRRRAREAGFDRHMIKPADIDELQAMLASLD